MAISIFFGIFSLIPDFYFYGGFTIGHHHFEFSRFTVSCLLIMKVILIASVFIQVKGGLAIVKPVIKEYKQAQNGETQGIRMTERKSKKMAKHIKTVKKLTCFWFLATFICVPLTIAFLREFVDQVASHDEITRKINNSASKVNIKYDDGENDD